MPASTSRAPTAGGSARSSTTAPRTASPRRRATAMTSPPTSPATPRTSTWSIRRSAARGSTRSTACSPGTAMADRSASLLAEVLADPASDPARQVLADELLTRGDPRGELVQIDFALDGPLSIRKRAALRARRAELVRDHAATWWPFALEYRVRRGFIEAVAGTLAQIAATADALFAAQPVVELTVN